MQGNYLEVEIKDRSDLIAFVSAYAYQNYFDESLRLLKKVSFLTRLEEHELRNLKWTHDSIFYSGPNSRLLKLVLSVKLHYKFQIKEWLMQGRHLLVFPLEYGVDRLILFGFCDFWEELEIKKSNAFLIKSSKVSLGNYAIIPIHLEIPTVLTTLVYPAFNSHKLIHPRVLGRIFLDFPLKSIKVEDFDIASFHSQLVDLNLNG